MAPGDKPKTWAEWQIRERRKRGWTQRELATAAGVGERSIKRYENGGSPQGEQVFLILSAFGFPVPEDAPLALNAEVAEMRRDIGALWSDVRRVNRGWGDVNESIRRLLGSSDVEQ